MVVKVWTSVYLRLEEPIKGPCSRFQVTPGYTMMSWNAWKRRRPCRSSDYSGPDGVLLTAGQGVKTLAWE